MTEKETAKGLLALLCKNKKDILSVVICLLFSSGINLIMPIINSKMIDEGIIEGNQIKIVSMVVLSLVCFLILSFVDLFKEKTRIE